MARVTQADKEKLQRIGLWDAFVKYRTALIEEGMRPTDAREKAISKFLENEDGSDKEEGLSGEKWDPEMVGKVPPAPGPVRREDFEGKPNVGEVTNILWVADNMRVVGLTPADCPSLRAWNLLCECREKAHFRANFWKDYYSKIVPAKNRLDGGEEDGEIDGATTLRLIERIRAIGEGAKQEAV